MILNPLTLEASEAAGSVAGSSATYLMFGVYIVFFVLLYLIFFRPQQKKKKKEEAMRKSAEIGDEITTIGGICGRIVGIKDENTIIVETGVDKSKIKLKRWAIGTVDTIHDTEE